MSGWFIALWAACLCLICVMVISVVWYRIGKQIDTMDNHLDRDMVHDYALLSEENKERIRLAVKDMRND